MTSALRRCFEATARYITLRFIKIEMRSVEKQTTYLYDPFIKQLLYVNAL